MSRELRRVGTLLGIALLLGTLATDTFRPRQPPPGFAAGPTTGPGPVRAPAAHAPPPAPTRLLFFTLDGVRPDEFFDCMEVPFINPQPDFSTCSFPNLWREVEAGNFEAAAMRVGNSENLSLPGYQTIFTGASQVKTCPNNHEDECAMPPVKTWLEEMVLAFGLRWYEVSVIASWRKMYSGVQSQPGRIHVNAGITDMDDPRDGDPGVPRALASANHSQSRRLPAWKDARKDAYTAEFAKWYFFDVAPRIQVVSWLDSDEYGHAGEFDNYRASLRWYDAKIREFRDELRRRCELQNTIVIVTTDHGRGRGGLGYAFRGHGPEWYLEHSSNAWFAISVPAALKPAWEKKKAALAKQRQFTQRDIKGIVRALLLGQ